MNEGKAVTAAADVLAGIWCEILSVDRVQPDDDFFSLGGDSLLAVRVVGAARERGLAISLLDLFKHPTPRGACAALGAGAEGRDTDRRIEAADPRSTERAATSLLTPRDRALVPEGAADVYPAGRMQLGLLYESLLSNGALYVDVVSRTVRRSLRPDLLRQALDVLVDRHPILRTRFDLGTFSQPMQVVEQHVPLPVEVADYRHVAERRRRDRHEEVMRGLARPYDPETVPLMRVHAAALGPDRFRLSYSFHHAVMDGWSEAVFVSELVRVYDSLLRGVLPDLEKPLPYVEFIRLEQAAVRDTGSVRFLTDLRATVPVGTSAPAAERAHRKVSAPVPRQDEELLAAHSAAWGVPRKSLLLAACAVAVGTVWDASAPVVGVLLNGRPESAGADLTLGLFLNQLPLRLPLDGATWHSAACNALAAENDLLPHRRFPYSELRTLLGGDAFDVTFNYVHFHPRDEMLAAGLLGVDEDMRDHTSLPVRVEALDDRHGHGLSVHITVDEAKFGVELADRLLTVLLAAVHRLAVEPEAIAGAPCSVPATSCPARHDVDTGTMTGTAGAGPGRTPVHGPGVDDVQENGS